MIASESKSVKEQRSFEERKGGAKEEWRVIEAQHRHRSAPFGTVRHCDSQFQKTDPKSEISGKAES